MSCRLPSCIYWTADIPCPVHPPMKALPDPPVVPALSGWQPTAAELVVIIRCLADYAGTEQWAKRNDWMAEARGLLAKLKAGAAPVVGLAPPSPHQRHMDLNVVLHRAGYAQQPACDGPDCIFCQIVFGLARPPQDAKD